jgi:hypothetical protein
MYCLKKLKFIVFTCAINIILLIQHMASCVTNCLVQVSLENIDTALKKYESTGHTGWGTNCDLNNSDDDDDLGEDFPVGQDYPPSMRNHSGSGSNGPAESHRPYDILVTEANEWVMVPNEVQGACAAELCFPRASEITNIPVKSKLSECMGLTGGFICSLLNGLSDLRTV